MAPVFKIVIIVCLLLLVQKQINVMLEIPPLPHLSQHEWWGNESVSKEDNEIKKFFIDAHDSVLEDLQLRLQTARPFPPPLEGVQHTYGINTNLLNEILAYWKKEYNFTRRKEYLNRYPHFLTNIQGINMHFIHKEPDREIVRKQKLIVIPILLLHGWPGSIREFYDLIENLTTPREGFSFVFEIIAPSLPGYGFSKSASRPGLGAPQVAVIMQNLMKRIGHGSYYVHGGDWGAIIGAMMSVLYPRSILGLHSTMCFTVDPISNLKLAIGSLYPSLMADGDFDTTKVYPLSSMYSYLIAETGYFHIQATVPDTIGVALNDSPAGLAAYILEKFIQWTEPSLENSPSGGLLEHYTYDALLDNVMFYWLSGSMTTAMRLYAETIAQAKTTFSLLRQPIEIPSACSRFRHELAYMPTTVLKHKFLNLVQVVDHSSGGHFAALQLPKLVANDIWTAVVKMRLV